MKKIFSTIFLLLWIYFSVLSISCNKQDLECVPYKPCPCWENKPSSGGNYLQGEAHLFKDSIPSAFREGSIIGKPYNCIIFNTITNEAKLIINFGSNMEGRGSICNFPYFVNDWKISHDGIVVNYVGTSYKPCNPLPAYDEYYFDFILTSLKIR